MEKYDLIICGAGPAGLTAGIYAVRYKLKTLVIGKMLGGLVAETSEIHNWPGVKDTNGMNLADSFAEHAKDQGVEIKQEEIIEIKPGFIVTTKKVCYEAKSIIIALGTKHRKLGVKGEEEYLGKGVSYCATCDGPMFRGKTVGVIGGSDSAVETAIMLSEYCEKVYIIYRKEKLRAKPVLIDALTTKQNIEMIYNANVIEVLGEQFVSKVKLDTDQEVELQGLFIEIGLIPSVEVIKNLKLELDEINRVKVGKKMETNVPGAFAAGDINNGELNQIVVAAGEGAIAATSAYKFIKNI